MRHEPVITEGAGGAGEKDLLPALQRWGLEREDTGAALEGTGREGGVRMPMQFSAERCPFSQVRRVSASRLARW